MKLSLILLPLLLVFPLLSVNASPHEEDEQIKIKNQNLQDNRTYYHNLDRSDKKKLVKLLYQRFSETEKASKDQRERFTKILSEVATTVTDNIINNPVFSVELPNFVAKTAENIPFNSLTGYASLVPSKTYLLDFEKRTIVLGGTYKKTKYSHNRYVFIAYDATRDISILSFPESNNVSHTAGSTLSYSDLKKKVKEFLPYFVFESEYEY